MNVESSERRFSHRPVKLFVAAALYALTLFVRINGINNAELQTDEIHWLQRSYKTLEQFRHGNYSAITSHLGQPGIPPTLFMALGEKIAETYNDNNHFEPHTEKYIDRLLAARLSNAIISSLVVPVLFLLGGALVGILPAGTASLLFALAPNHIALSQIAHLDAQLALYVTTSVLSFAYAVERKSLKAKLLSGVFWGLAISTKPTAATLIPIFILYKGLRWIFYRKSLAGENSITWSDVWAVVVGLIVLISLYTRLWESESQYFVRLKIESNLADVFNHWAGEPLLLRGLMFGIVVGCLILLCYASRLSKFKVPVINLSALAGVLSAFGLLLPDVTENFIRFWMWAAGLRSMRHQSFGLVWEPPKYGYFGLVVTKFPSLILIVTAISILFFLPRLKRCWRGAKEFGEENQRFLVIAFFLLCFLIWPLPLSASTKQALRYYMPVGSMIYLFGVEGVCKLATEITQRLSFCPMIVKRTLGEFLVCSGMLAFQVFAAISSYPHYELYYNSLFGGVPGAVARREILPSVGLSQAVSFLQQFAKEKGEPIKVGTIGDITSLEYLQARLFPHEEKKVVFREKHNMTSSEYFLSTGVFHSDIDKYLGAERKNVTPLFTYSVKGVELTAVYKVPPLTLSEPFTFDLMLTPSKTGKRPKYIGTSRSKNGGIRALEVDPGSDRKGYMVFGEGVRLSPGKYFARFYLALPQAIPPNPELTPDRYAVRLDFTSVCSRIVTLGELSSEEVRSFDVECNMSQEGKFDLRAYWFGNVPLVLTAMEVDREKSD